MGKPDKRIQPSLFDAGKPRKRRAGVSLHGEGLAARMLGKQLVFASMKNPKSGKRVNVEKRLGSALDYLGTQGVNATALVQAVEEFAKGFEGFKGASEKEERQERYATARELLRKAGSSPAKLTQKAVEETAAILFWVGVAAERKPQRQRIGRADGLARQMDRQARERKGRDKPRQEKINFE